uniref:Fibrinogen C-terminal domain-containing protein n=1 Tax=Heterorhabditis bacteriophora TaxID=37862 RepID=A0A1I7X510_HETBA
MYVLGAGQHMHLYSRPSPEAVLDGEDIMGRQEIQSNGWVNNQYGVWIRIAGTQKYLLAENSVGRSSIHSQSYSTNGNDDEEGSPPSKQSIGYGYNSSGKFITGWSGDCGSGGRANSTWYLLCSTCRTQYLRKTPAGHRQASSTATSGWTINLFPAQTPSPPAMGRSGLLGKGRSMFRVGHASDPGPKGLPLMSPPSASIGPTSSLGQYRTHQSIHEGTGDTQEVLQSPSAALRTLITHSTPNTSAMLKRPVLAFVVEHHNLKR